MSFLLLHLLSLALFQHPSPQCCRYWDGDVYVRCCRLPIWVCPKELIQGLVQSCIPSVDVPQLSSDCEVVDCTEYDLQLFQLGGGEPHLLAAKHTLRLHSRQQ